MQRVSGNDASAGFQRLVVLLRVVRVHIAPNAVRVAVKQMRDLAVERVLKSHLAVAGMGLVQSLLSSGRDCDLLHLKLRSHDRHDFPSSESITSTQSSQ